MRKLLLLAALCLLAAPVRADGEKAYREGTARRGDEPIAPLSEKLGVNLVCVDGFLYAKNGDSLQIITRAVPVSDLGMLVNAPIRCVDGRFFPDGIF